MRAALSLFVLTFLFPSGCGGAANEAPATEPGSQTSTAPPLATAAPPTADFGPNWAGVTVQVEPTEEAHGLADGMARAVFEVVWTEGQTAGVLYPKKFVDTSTNQEVTMEFLRDNGGNIEAGVYDILIDHDGRLGEGWLKSVKLDGPNELRVVVDMNACMLALPLETYPTVTVYPAGTYQEYQARNELDSIPDKVAISWYNSENKGAAALAPSGKVDLKLTHADGTSEWRQGYELPANRKLGQL